jgi:hypothetical protein
VTDIPILVSIVAAVPLIDLMIFVWLISKLVGSA